MKRLYFLSTLMLFVIAAMLPQNVKAQVSVWDGTYAPWTNGTGTEADPFLIENAQQLAYLANRVNNGLDAGGGHVSNHDLYYKLMTDVDLNGSEDFQWTPIGYWISETNYYSFGGHFDGNNHAVSGLYINSSANRVGFFGYTDGATIENLSVAGDTVATIGFYAGGIVGYAIETDFMNCHNTCNISVTAADDSHIYCGGIVGFVVGERVFIANSNNAGKVSSPVGRYSYSAGIVGYNNSIVIIKNCYNTGSIISTSYSTSGDSYYGWVNDDGSFSGGIVGCNNSHMTMLYCFNTGIITAITYSRHYGSSGYTEYSYGGRARSGGLIGSGNNTTIMLSYNCGNVYSCSNIGGGCVGAGTSTVTNCYYLDTCGNNTYGGSPMNAALMQTAEFVDILNNGSCAWEQDVPPYVNNGYPILTMIIQEAYTEPATDIMAVSATLHGYVAVENAAITTKGFEYRELGDSTFISVNVTGNDNSFSYMLNGLTPNTTYEYRTFVNVSECPYTSYGDIQTFEVSWLNADTILIYDADMLQWVSDRCNTGTTFEGKYIKLMNNIVLPLNQPNNMTSIGVYPSYPFKGTFDGNGMTITNLYIDQPNTPYQGFFGYTQNANLYQVGLVNITASGRNYTGGMVAYADNTYMRDCYVNGGSLFALSYCGGLVGYQSEGTNSIISGCYNTCTVSGASYVGGLVGFSNYATVRNSYVAASVAAQGTAVGAIIGGANEVLMYNCYFSTSITGQSDAIGEHNFRDGEGLSNEEMQSTQFVATLNQGLVTPVWKSDYAVPINNGFPILIWQYSDAEACEAPENLSYIISGNSATLTWDGGDNASYFTIEYGMSGDDVHTENTSNHLLVIHDLQNGNYFWRVKSVCSFGESNFVNGSTIETGINNHDLNASLNVYPNPTTDIVNVELTINNGQSGDVAIQVYDMYGKLLDVVNVGNTDAMNRVPTDHSVDSYGVANTHGLSAQTTQIDLSRYTNGVYFIKAVSEGNVLTVRKVVKNR